MDRMIYQVAVGKQSNLYEHCIKSVANYCKKYNLKHIVQTEPILKIRPDVNRTGRSKEAVERLGYLPIFCLLYTSPSQRHGLLYRMPSSA